MKINKLKQLTCLLGVAVFATNASGQHFQEQTAQSFQGAYYGDCATMDIDNNDFPDLIFSGAVPGYATGHTSVYVNTDGVLSSIENEFSSIMFSAIGLGDIDSNGYQDFAITGTRVETGEDQSNVFEIYYNNGDNTFTKDDDAGISYTNYGSVEVADLNDDGMPDILVNGLSNNVYISKVYFQEEGGTFQESSTSFMGTYFSDSKIFDANGDGLNDILITGFNTSYVPDAVLYINQGNGGFEIQESGIGGVYFSSLSLADFDNDGDIDILVSGMDTTYSASLVLYLNDGTGLFMSSTSTFSGVYSGSCALVDYNNDGFLDVFAIGSDGNQNKVKLYQNQNNTSFVEDTQNAAILTGLNMSSATWLDFDNDNDQDLFIMGYNVDNVAQSILYENTIEIVNDDYCEVSVDFDVEPITSVEVANLTNATSAAIDGTPAYEDFTDLVADLVQGQTYTLTVKGNTNGNFEHDIRVFMDWNNDYSFDMDTEYYTASLQPSTGEDDVEVSIEITVPADANLGNARMRITKDMWNVYEDGDFDACTNAYYGQVEDYTINITESTSVAVESVEVTTENNATAEITTENGTLQLVATVTPTDALQEVTWTIESGDEFVSVDNNGLVTAIANGVATIRAISIEDSAVFDEIDVTVDIEAANECESVETFLETFETFTEFPAQCWNANYTNYAVSISDEDETVQLYSGGATDEIIIVSPEVSTIDGQHVLAFDMVSITQPGTMLQVGTMTDNTDFTTFTAVGDSFAPVGGTTHTTATIPANEGHKYVAVKYTFPANSHIVLKLDNIEWKVAASNDRFDQNRVKIYPNPTSGLFYIDTDIPVRNIEVYNAIGQKVASTQHKEVDLSNVARGTYIVRVYATDGTFAAYKLVKK